uniref:Cytochrome P450 n=1 Tax=Steinernema glaseri TaxID=37863 RepID=A0A1I8AQR8_9BILA
MTVISGNYKFLVHESDRTRSLYIHFIPFSKNTFHLSPREPVPGRALRSKNELLRAISGLRPSNIVTPLEFAECASPDLSRRHSLPLHSRMHVLVYVAVFVVGLVYFYGKSFVDFVRRRRRLIRLIDRIPGPPSYPIVGSVLNFSPNSEKFTYQMEYYFRVFAEGTQNDGIIKMWIGPMPIVLLTRAETIKTLLESQTLISKPPEYHFIKKWLGEGLLTSTGDKWYQRRKMLTPTFHFSILQNFIPIFNGQTGVMLECLEKHEDGRRFDFYPYIKLVALDIISETAMGVNINAQLGENEEYVSAVRRLSELIWHQMRFPWLWLKPVWYGSGMGYEFDECLKVIEGMSNK